VQYAVAEWLQMTDLFFKSRHYSIAMCSRATAVRAAVLCDGRILKKIELLFVGVELC
jgi:hypothetical protein